MLMFVQIVLNTSHDTAVRTLTFSRQVFLAGVQLLVYFVTDMNINYQLSNWTFGIIVENLFDTKWNETQFLTESRLFFEPQPVEEIHFTPGSPFFVRGKVSVSF